MLDSTYHVTLKNLQIAFWRKNVNILSFCMQCCYGRHYTTLVNM